MQNTRAALILVWALLGCSWLCPAWAEEQLDKYGGSLRVIVRPGASFHLEKIGIEHWCLYDPAVSNWCDNENFGLATVQDNAYHGVETRRATGTDARGYHAAREDTDYGNLLGPLSEFLQSTHDVVGTQ